MNQTRRRGGPRGPRPDLWKSGPDPVEHRKYLNWLQQRAQANHRQETWLLDFETWKAIWGEAWHNKGRGSDNFCMTRQDPQGAWEENNVEIITRRDHVLRQDQYREVNWRCGPKKKRAQA